MAMNMPTFAPPADTGQPTSSHQLQLSSNNILHDRYVQNTLLPVPLDAASLQETLTELQAAIIKGVQTIREHTANQKTDSDRRDSIYVGHTGIALTLLRLFAQAKSIGFNSPSHLLSRLSASQDFTSHISFFIQPVDLVHSYLPTIRPHHPRPGRLSPLDSSIGPAIVYVLTRIVFPEGELDSKRVSVRGSGFDYGHHNRHSSYLLSDVVTGLSTQGPEPDPQWDAAVTTLRHAIQVAMKDATPGNDEVLYGRAGLLSGLFNLRVWLGLDNGGVSVGISPERKRTLTEITNDSVIGGIIEKIIEAGEEGRKTYEKSVGEEGLPLMWAWHDKWYLGAVHGVAGILTVLLQAPRHLVSPYLSLITSCISALCSLTILHNGHLPVVLPTKLKLSHYAKGDPNYETQSLYEKPTRANLVQLCHGAPGLLLLLGTMRTRFPVDYERLRRKARARSKSKSTPMDTIEGSSPKKHRRPSDSNRTNLAASSDWSEAERLASDRIWQEGLLRKGVGLCHGVSGNGWIWLLSSLSGIDDPDSDPIAALSFSRALSFLRHSTLLPPMPSADPTLHSIYRRPDRPYSLFEGLAGAVCAWADACVVIKERLDHMQTQAHVSPIVKPGEKPVPEEGDLYVRSGDEVPVSPGIDEADTIWGTGGVVGSTKRSTKGSSVAGIYSGGNSPAHQHGSSIAGSVDKRPLQTEKDKKEWRRDKDRNGMLVLGIPGLGGARVRGIL